jgi:hypothetical protein
MRFIFPDEKNISISRDTNYIRPLQQHNALITLQMHTAKKEKKKLRNKVPLQHSSPSNINTSTTKTTPEI